MQVAAAGAAPPPRPGQPRRPLQPRPQPAATCRTAPESLWSPVHKASMLRSSSTGRSLVLPSGLAKLDVERKAGGALSQPSGFYFWQVRAPPLHGANGVATPRWSPAAACLCTTCASGGLAAGHTFTLLPDSTACQQVLLPRFLFLKGTPAIFRAQQGRAHRIRAGASGAAGRVQRLWGCAHPNPLL